MEEQRHEACLCPKLDSGSKLEFFKKLILSGHVICPNATPLINFASVNRLDMLKSLFGKIIVPSQVWDEVVTKASEYDTSKVIKSADFITIKNVKDKILYKTLLMGINKDKAEAIVLALEIKASLVVLDEKLAKEK